MDLSFGRKHARRTVAALRLDYPRLIAILASVQSASRTAQVAGRLSRGRISPAEDGLVALFDPGADWMAVTAKLGGSFNPRVARLGRKPV
jgi:hypothetical protein